MPIVRSRDQSDQTLSEFYGRKDWKGALRVVADNMLGFINSVNRVFPRTTFVAYTSHQRLCIQSEHATGAEWLIIISNAGTDDYYFEFKLPNNKSPWKDAWVTGKASGLDEALRYLIIAMLETQAWNDNEELKKLADARQISRNT